MKDMLDRYKFRIWDKPTSKMFYDVCIGFIKAPINSDWVCADTPDGQINYINDRLKDIEIMQCTGLKDKNLKLIYEGDIIRQPDGCIGVIVWQGVSYWTESPGSYARDLEHTPYYENVEVIGNVYENPELLEVNNDI